MNNNTLRDVFVLSLRTPGMGLFPALRPHEAIALCLRFEYVLGLVAYHKPWSASA